jgi:hypothetical protein
VDPQEFTKPDNHPFGMLQGFANASQKESLLAWMLSQCIEAGDWIDIPCKHDHSAMVAEGLLEQTGERIYRLTKKSKGLLYAHYGKE